MMPNARPPAPPIAAVCVIPAYNAAGTIARAVASAKRECARVIVVDDGSSDATGEVARAAGATVIRQHNAGPGAARNTALIAAVQLTPTLPVLFLDADDELLSSAAEVLADAFIANPSVAAVVAGHVAIGPPPDGPTPRVPESAWVSAGTLPSRGLALGPYHIFCTSGLVLSPAAAAELRFDDRLHFAEDRDLIYRAGALGPIAVIKGPLIHKHIGAGLTDDPTKVRRWLDDQLALARKHCPARTPGSGPDPAFEPLRACTEWVVKHAIRTGAGTPHGVDSGAWREVHKVFAQRCWALGSSVRRAYWAARVTGVLSRTARP